MFLLHKQLEEQKRREQIAQMAGGGKSNGKKEGSFKQRRNIKEKKYSSALMSNSFDKDSVKQGSLYEDVDDIMNDEDKLKQLQRMIEEKNNKPEIGEKEKKLEQIKEEIQTIFEMHYEGQQQHEELKRRMNYKYPTDKIKERYQKIQDLYNVKESMFSN